MKSKILLITITTILFLIVFGLFVSNSYVISNYPGFFRGMATGITSLTIIIWIIAFITVIWRGSKSEGKKIQWMPKNQMFLSAGMICMFTGSLMAINNKDNTIILFINVIVFILSMIFNIIYIRRIRTSLFRG